MSVHKHSITPELPWSSNHQQEKRFYRILASLLFLLLLAIIIIPFVRVPQLERSSLEKVPNQVARFILEKQEITPPKAMPVPKARKTAKPSQKKSTTKARAKEQGKPLNPTQRNAQEVAQKHISSFSSSLAKINDSLPVVPQTVQIISSKQASGTQSIDTGKLNTGLISTRIHAGGGTITIAKSSKISAPKALSSAPMKRVSRTLGLEKPGTEIQKETSALKSERKKQIKRSRENIQSVFDKNKGAIYAIYNRGLRNNPDLEGKVVFQLSISPGGKVTQCEISSSDLNSPKLERKLIARIKLFAFGEVKDVDVWRDTFYLDFIPSQ